MPINKAINLSPQEMKVLQQIIKGYKSAEIAQNLNLSKRTIDSYRSNMLNKTGCKNSSELIIHALRENLIAL